MSNGRTLYHPRISSARAVWRVTYAEGISFEEFYELSQMNCTYCGNEPQNITNKFKSRTSNVSTYSIENGDFIYNGLDRINQTLLHTKDNCVSCCWPCNDRKGTLSKSEFLEWIQQVYHNCFIERPQENPELKTKIATMLLEKSIWPQAKYHPRITSARQLWNEYDKEFVFEDFLELTQMNCFYCGAEPKSIRNHFKYCKTEVSQYAIDNGDFVYNGLDRINNTLSHTKDNVVTCCWPCNDRKSDSSKDQFLEWIDKTYKHLISVAHM